jgi:prolyl oligopeptidase
MSTGPPDTPKLDGDYEFHGETIADPYRWLEDADDDAVREWVDAQNEYADERLASLPTREALRDRVEELARTTEYEAVVPTEGGYFQRVRDPDQDRSVLYHMEDPDGERRELVDPNDWDDAVSMTWYEPSPDGAHVVYGVDEGGQENFDVHVLDVDSGEDVAVLADCGRANATTGTLSMVTGEDGLEGFYYVRTGGPGEGQLDKELRYHELGTEPGDDVVVKTEFSEQTWPSAVTDRTSEHVVVAESHGWERSDLYYLDHAAVERARAEGGDVDLTPLVTGVDAVMAPELADGTCYVRTTHEAPNYRVAEVPLEDPAGTGPEDLATVVPEDDDATLEAFAVADDRLLVQRTRDVVSELAAFDPAGDGAAAHVTDLDLPGTGSVEGLRAHPGAREATFTYTGFDQPPTQMRWTGGEAVTAVSEPDAEVRADVVVDQEWVDSTDGAEVPAFVVRRADVDPDGSNPALLYGYGGFDISQTPAFRRYVAPFLEAGGVFAVGNFRGGGEFGEDWHDAGRREHKQHTFDDVFAVAEHLRERWADRLAVWGGSNGGLTVGASITQRPDLFDAALCQVPLLDMLRFHTSLLGASWTTEYGDPDDPEEAEWVRSYSPYHHVEERAYPDVLFTTALGDSRVDPFHAWKTAARMQERADGEFLLKTYEATGHGTGKSVSQAVEEALDEGAFLFDRLGVDPV